MTDMQDSQQNTTDLGQEYEQTIVNKSSCTYESNAKYAVIYEIK